MSIMDYATEQGWKPKGVITARDWFSQHPEAAQAVHEGRQHGLSYRQIGAYLIDKHNAPFSGDHWVKAGLDV